MEAKDIPDGLYLKIGDKFMRVDNLKDGKPVIKEGVTSEETTNPDGTKDCTVHVPCFQIQSKVEKPKLSSEEN